MGQSSQKERSSRIEKYVVLHSKSTAYLVEEIIGQGAFAEVGRCTDLYKNKEVAIKFLGRDCYKLGNQEGNTLNKLKELDPDKNNLVKFYERFKYKGHNCLVMEKLDISLYDFMVNRKSVPLHLCEIRLIAQQLLVALNTIHSIGLSHIDIKPDNVMLVNHQSQPFKVKLVDFGLAQKTSSLWRFERIQNLTYRAPEVYLDIPFNESVDIWSLGCTLAFLYIGRNLFPDDSEYQVMKTIVKIIGIPDYLLNMGGKTEIYFKQIVKDSIPVWTLKTCDEYKGSLGDINDPWHIYKRICSLDSLPTRHFVSNQRTELPEETKAFMSLLKCMLQVDPANRISAAEALNHPFITQGTSSGTTDTSLSTLTQESTTDFPLSAATIPKPAILKNNCLLRTFVATKKEGVASRNEHGKDQSEGTEEAVSNLSELKQVDLEAQAKMSDSFSHPLIPEKHFSVTKNTSSQTLTEKNTTKVQLSAATKSKPVRLSKDFTRQTNKGVASRNKQGKDQSEDTQEAVSNLSELKQVDLEAQASTSLDPLPPYFVTSETLTEKNTTEVQLSPATTSEPASVGNDFTQQSNLGARNKDAAASSNGAASRNEQGKDQSEDTKEAVYNPSELKLVDLEAQASTSVDPLPPYFVTSETLTEKNTMVLEKSYSETGLSPEKEETPRTNKVIVLHSKSNAYLVQEIIGQGAYAEVARCKDLNTNEEVAIKILDRNFYKFGNKEGKTLNKLKKLDPDKNNLVKFYERFRYQGHNCLVMEKLDISLYDLMVNRNSVPLHLSKIRLIAQQLLVALDTIHSMGLSHADIKPDNVMLVNHRSQPFKVKLVDFGLAEKTSELCHFENIQNLTYRAPEVYLNLPLDESIDIWSLGCTLAFLYIGKNLFPDESEYQVMKTIVKIIGIPDYLLDMGGKTNIYFKQIEKDSYPYWKLRTSKEYEGNIGDPRDPWLIYKRISSLDNLPETHFIVETPEDTEAFISLLKCMLQVDSENRISAAEALNHPFITQRPSAGTSNTCSSTLTQENTTGSQLSAATLPKPARLKNKSLIRTFIATRKEGVASRNEQDKDQSEDTQEAVSNLSELKQVDLEAQAKMSDSFSPPLIPEKHFSVTKNTSSQTLTEKNTSEKEEEKAVRSSVAKTPTPANTKDGKSHQQISGHVSVIDSKQEGSPVITKNSCVVTHNDITMANVHAPHTVCKETKEAADLQPTAPAGYKQTLSKTINCSGGVKVSAPHDQTKPAAKIRNKKAAGNKNMVSPDMSNTAPQTVEQSRFAEVKTRKTFYKRICNFFRSLMCCRKPE